MVAAVLAILSAAILAVHVFDALRSWTRHLFRPPWSILRGDGAVRQTGATGNHQRRRPSCLA